MIQVILCYHDRSALGSHPCVAPHKRCGILRYVPFLSLCYLDWCRWRVANWIILDTVVFTSPISQHLRDLSRWFRTFQTKQKSGEKWSEVGVWESERETEVCSVFHIYTLLFFFFLQQEFLLFLWKMNERGKNDVRGFVLSNERTSSS